MTMIRLGEEWIDIAAPLSDSAFRMATEAMIWSVKRGLDLRVPHSHIPKFAETRADHIKVVAELLDRGFWLDLGTMYDIGVVEEGRIRPWQWSKDQVLNHRKNNRERQARYRAKSSESRDQSSSSVDAQPNSTQPRVNALRNGVTNGVTNGVSQMQTSKESPE